MEWIAWGVIMMVWASIGVYLDEPFHAPRRSPELTNGEL